METPISRIQIVLRVQTYIQTYCSEGATYQSGAKLLFTDRAYVHSVINLVLIL